MRKKIFVACSDDQNDENIALRYFISVLEKECDYECIFYNRDFEADKTTIENVVDTIKKCHKMFVIVTKHSLIKNWVAYKMLLAMEKSQRSTRLCVTLFLFNVDRSDIQGQLFGVLSEAMLVEVNPNKDNWESVLKQDMIKKINENSPMSPVNVVANVSVGQAWSHFTGYGRIVLPCLKDRITSSKWYQQNPDRFPVCEFNLVPNSAKTVRQLNELDKRIKYEGCLEKIISGRGSFADRPYEVSVYSITDHDGKKYFFVGQIPNTLSILSKLEHFGESDTERTGCIKMSKGERSLQVARFANLYNRLVNHAHSRDCNNMLEILQYNDDRQNVGDVLLKAIKQRLLQASSPVTSEDSAIVSTQTDVSPSADDRKFLTSVFVDCLDSCDKDRQTKQELDQYLESNGFNVWQADPSKPQFQNLGEAVSTCKWAIFVLSDNAFKDPDFHLLHFKFRSVLTESVEKNEMRVIPVADGISEAEISQDLRAVTYISKQEPHYKRKLLQTLKCESIPMECPVKAEEVHQGLAWAYVLNYLYVTLQDRTKQFEMIEKNNPHCYVYKKLFVVIPSSCGSKSLGALDRDEHGNLIDPNFEQMQDIQYKSQDVGGVVGRKYQLVTYKIKAPAKEYIVAVEYPNAVLCLQEMSDLQPVSGLARDKLHDEAWGFHDLAKAIINCRPKPASCPNLKNLVELLYFDDSKWTVADAILEVIQQEVP